MQGHADIRIGTLVPVNDKTTSYLRQILSHGFESFELTFPVHLDGIDLRKLATEVRQVLDEQGNAAVVSSVGVYGNPLVDAKIVESWQQLIDGAELFGCHMVCGFTGRIVNRPVPDSMADFKRVFGPLAKRAEDRGVRIAFENCDMHGTWEYGDWNIAHAPAAWEMMFHEVPSDALGLEWEPCHQMVSLIDPLPQLRKWVQKVYHVHGKDANILWDVVKTSGIRGGKPYVYHRTPGFGDTNWHEVITILRQAGYRGSIDIEGWHDPVYRDDLETTGQVYALKYLQKCRGGDFVANPE
jgi:sugar phosphate isomerase/epimerase